VQLILSLLKSAKCNHKTNNYFLNPNFSSAISATYSPIAKEAVAAGDGAFNTDTVSVLVQYQNRY